MPPNPLANPAAEAKIKILGDRLDDIHSEVLVDTSADTLTCTETDRHRNALGHVQAKALKKMLAFTQELLKARESPTLRLLLNSSETIGDALGDPNYYTIEEAKAYTLQTMNMSQAEV